LGSLEQIEKAMEKLQKTTRADPACPPGRFHDFLDGFGYNRFGRPYGKDTPMKTLLIALAALTTLAGCGDSDPPKSKVYDSARPGLSKGLFSDNPETNRKAYDALKDVFKDP